MKEATNEQRKDKHMAKKDFKATTGAAAFISQVKDTTEKKPEPATAQAETDAPGKLHSAQEVADYLGVTRRTLYTYIKDGKIEGLKIGRQWKFTDAQIDALLSNSAE